MNITQTDIAKVKPNPNNPRIIKDDKYKALVKSIKDFPQMLQYRPVVVNDDMVVLGGNMRLKACKEAGMKTVPVIKASELTEEQQREFIIKDNVGFGEWDWDTLANEWDAEKLEDWGLNVGLLYETKKQNTQDQSEYDFENYDNTGITTIRIVLPDEKAKELMDKLDSMKHNLTTSEYLYEHFCN